MPESELYHSQASIFILPLVMEIIVTYYASNSTCFPPVPSSSLLHEGWTVVVEEIFASTLCSNIEFCMGSISPGGRSVIVLIPVPYDITRLEITVLHGITDGHAFAAADDAICESGFLQILQSFGRIDPAMPGVPTEGPDA